MCYIRGEQKLMIAQQTLNEAEVALNSKRSMVNIHFLLFFFLWCLYEFTTCVLSVPESRIITHLNLSGQKMSLKFTV